MSRFAQGGRESFSEKASSMWLVVTRKRLPTPFASHTNATDLGIDRWRATNGIFELSSTFHLHATEANAARQASGPADMGKASESISTCLPPTVV